MAIKKSSAVKKPRAAKKADTAGKQQVLPASKTPAATASKKLIIAEKPSVANDIARVLGGFTKQGDYFESNDYVLSSAVGHLLTLAVPEQFEVKRGKWSFAHLPMIPPHFDLQPIERSEERL